MSSSVAVPLEGERARPKWTPHIILLVASIAVVLASFLLSVDGPTNVVIPWLKVPLPPTCALQRVFHLDCPGCGLTRSFITLAHGQLDASLAFNPAGILMYGVVLFQIPYRLAQLWRLKRGLPTWNLNPVSIWIASSILIVLMTQWIVKMST